MYKVKECHFNSTLIPLIAAVATAAIYAVVVLHLNAYCQELVDI
jgi:hypothetical protein